MGRPLFKDGAGAHRDESPSRVNAACTESSTSESAVRIPPPSRAPGLCVTALVPTGGAAAPPPEKAKRAGHAIDILTAISVRWSQRSFDIITCFSFAEYVPDEQGLLATLSSPPEARGSISPRPGSHGRSSSRCSAPFQLPASFPDRSSCRIARIFLHADSATSGYPRIP